MATARRAVLCAAVVLAVAVAGCTQAPAPGPPPSAREFGFTTDWGTEPRFVVVVPGGLPPGFRVVLTPLAAGAPQEFSASELRARSVTEYEFVAQDPLEPGARYRLEALAGERGLAAREFQVVRFDDLHPEGLVARATYRITQEATREDGANRTVAAANGTLFLELTRTQERRSLSLQESRRSQGGGMELAMEVVVTSAEADGRTLEGRASGRGTFRMPAAQGAGTATLDTTFAGVEPKLDGSGRVREAEVWRTAVEGEGTVAPGGSPTDFTFRTETTEWRDVASDAPFWLREDTTFTAVEDDEPQTETSSSDRAVDRAADLERLRFEGLQPFPLAPGDRFAARAGALQVAFAARAGEPREVAGQRFAALELEGTVGGAGAGTRSLVVVAGGALAGLPLTVGEDLRLGSQSFRRALELTRLS